MPAAAIAGAGIVGGLISSNAQKKAAKSAANAQTAASDASIAEQRRQFDLSQQLVQPYVNAGVGALGQQQNLMGLNGTSAQQTAINNLQNSPFFQSVYKQAENALLQNAAATGGLRGGNIQGALADNRMNMLNTAYQNQLQNLGNLVTLGQNSATNTGTNAMAMANNIGNLNTNIGQAQAGYALARGQSTQNMLGTLMGGAGLAYLGYNQYQGQKALVNNLTGSDYVGLGEMVGMF